MIGLILAGGKGTRLHPHTEEIPKPLLDINGKAILAHQIETLSALNISPIVIVTGFLSHKIEQFIADQFPDQEIIFVHNEEYEQSRPAFGIIKALPHLTDDVIYLNGDVLYDTRILEQICRSPHHSATAIQKVPWDEEEVNVIINPDMSIKHISKNILEEQSHGEFIGVTKLGKQFLAALEAVIAREGSEAFRFSFAVDLLNHVITIQGIPLIAEDVSDFEAIEIDTPEDYEQALKKHRAMQTYEKTSD